MSRMLTGLVLGVCFSTAVSTAFGGTIRPQVIYGQDGRADVYQVNDAVLRDLADSTLAQFQSNVLSNLGSVVSVGGEIYGSAYGLCQDEPYFRQPASAVCSAFLVGPDLIATAGHCVEASTCGSVNYAFGFKMLDANRPATQLPAGEVYKCKEVVARELTRQQDYAIVRLDRPVTNHKILKLAAQPALANDPVFVIGHPAGLPTKITTGGVVRTSNAAFFVTNLDTYGGNSGSAVFNARTGEVSGILVRGEQDFARDNMGSCNRSNFCPETGCRGEDVTHISYVRQALGAR